MQFYIQWIEHAIMPSVGNCEGLPITDAAVLYPLQKKRWPPIALHLAVCRTHWSSQYCVLWWLPQVNKLAQNKVTGPLCWSHYTNVCKMYPNYTCQLWMKIIDLYPVRFVIQLSLVLVPFTLSVSRPLLLALYRVMRS